MSWNVKYAACRYFRRVGATVNKADKLIVFNTPPLVAKPAHQKYVRALTKLGYCFSESLFINKNNN